MKKILPEMRFDRALCALAVFMLVVMAFARAPAHASPGPAGIKVEQVFTTSSLYAEDTFTYMLKPLDAGAPMPAGSAAAGYAFTIAGNGAYNISLPAFGRAGNYRYEIYQSVGEPKPGYTYDRRAYTIEAHVDANMNATIVVYNNEKHKVSKIVFENGFRVFPTDPGQMFDPPVVKTVTGSPAWDSEFKFVLTAHSASNPMPAGASGATKGIWITGPGWARFGTWSYDRPGNYYYTVHEERGGVSGYSYDTSVYTIVDRVWEEKGYLMLSRVVTDAMNKPVSSFDFLNVYSPLDRILGGGGAERENPNIPRGNVDEDPYTDLDDGGNPGGGLQINNNEPAPPPSAGVPVSVNTPTGSRPGTTGPKTGDDSNAALYIILMAAGGLIVLSATIYLLVAVSRRKRMKKLSYWEIK
ncbi:MAG: hypothetical protein FWH01_14070 [Oscillospiraceae bacterium]|nr:hypothetical protein [Oscillospiraceae bacterium]